MASGNEPSHFYINLLRKASQKHYPSKTLSSFKVHLARPVDLGSNSRWEVGVCELTCRPVNVGTFGGMSVLADNKALIYCDLISPQLFGSHYIRVIRTFILPTTYCNHTFDPVYFMPVEKRRFHDIEIQIKRLDGSTASFRDSEVPVQIVLHFRRVSPGTN
jgi:hypothetical protein